MDYIYIDDTASASVLAMKHGTPGETNNVGTGKSTEFNAIFKIVREEMGCQDEAEYV